MPVPRLLELFAGTQSIAKAFRAKGWQTISLDINDKMAIPDILSDVLLWDHTAFEPGYFDVVWASPVCTHYSIARTTAKTPRDLEFADSLVQRVLDLIAYFKPHIWLFENPYSGLLKSRPLVQGLPVKRLCYCRYGFQYRKETGIWTNLGDAWIPRPLCTKQDPCEHVVNGRHPKTAQRAPTRVKGILMKHDRCSLAQLYSIPPDLCKELCDACDAVIRATSSSNAP